MSDLDHTEDREQSSDIDADLQHRLTQQTITRSLRPVDLSEEAALTPALRTPPEPAGGDAVDQPDDISEEATIDLAQGAEPDLSISDAQTMDRPDVSISDAQTMDRPRGEGGRAGDGERDSRSVALPRHMGNWQELTLLPLPDDPDGVIGAGGQATIYSYVQRELGRDVAVKALRPEGRHYEAIEDLMREACVTARLEHPNIVPVHYLHLPEHDRDAPYWVMKRIHGKALTAHLPGDEDPWSIDRLLDVFHRILDAMAFAHSRGIVHRDLKPDNVLVGAFGEVQVTDWGLAVAVTEEGARGAKPVVEADAAATGGEAPDQTDRSPTSQELSGEIAKLNADVRSGTIGALLKSSSGGRAGTPVYMAPEQLDLTADSIDERTDVFLLGGILYAMLSGSPPHDLSGLKGAEEMFGAIRSCSTLVPPEERREAKGWDACPEGLSPIAAHGLSAITMKALSRQPEDRHASVEVLVGALDTWEAESASAELTANAQSRLEETESARRPSARAYAEVIALADAALERVKTNVLAQQIRDRASAALTAIQRRSVRRLWTAAAAIALVFVVGAIGYWRTRYQHNRAVVARNEAEKQQEKAEQLAAAEAEQRKQAEVARADAETQRARADDARKDAEAKAVALAKQLDDAYWEAYRKFAEGGDPAGQLLIAIAARNHAKESKIASSRPWGLLISASLKECPRLAGSTPTSNGWLRACFSPSGDLLAAGDRWGNVKLWDVATGRERATLQGTAGDVWGLSFSPDGSTLASGVGEIHLWDVATSVEAGAGREKATLRGHFSCVYDTSFSPDGVTLASGSADDTVRLWHVAASLARGTGCERAVLKGHSHSVRSVCFSPDGSTVASGSWDSTIKLWDVATGRVTAVLRSRSGPANGVSFSPDGTMLASGHSGRAVKLWNVAASLTRGTGVEKMTLRGHSHAVWHTRFDATGDILASASQDGTIKLWDPAAGSARATLKGHTGSVEAVSFNPDGALLASASRDNTIKLWDVIASLEHGAGREVASLSGHLVPNASVCFSPDGSTFAGGTIGNKIKLWDAVTGGEKATLSGHRANVFSLCFTADGSTLASSSGDGAVKLWDVQAGRERATLRGHSQPVHEVTLSPDGRTVASASHDGTTRLWDVSTGRERAALRGHRSRVYAVGFSPDGKTLATGSADQTIKLWDVASRRDKATLRGHSSTVHGVCFSPDGAVLASGSGDKTVKLWDTATRQVKHTLVGHAALVFTLAFSRDSTTLASSSEDKSVRLWDVATGRQKAVLRAHSAPVYTVSFSPEGTTLASGGGDRTIKLWDLAPSHNRIVLRGHSTSVYGVTLSPDGRMVASACRDGTIKLWEAQTGRLVTTLRGHSAGVHDVRFSPNGATLASCSDDHTIKLWEAVGLLSTGQAKELRTMRGHSEGVIAVDFSPDGAILASGSGDKTIKLWDVAGGREMVTLKGHARGVGSVSFSSDGRTLLSGSADLTVRMWDVPASLKGGRGRQTASFHRYLGAIHCVRFSPDGATFATASGDRTVKLRDAVTGREKAVLKGHTHEVHFVCFSPDGTMLASGGKDGVVRLWSAATGHEICVFTGHSTTVYSLAFSPNGATLASASGDGTVRLWDVRPELSLSIPQAMRLTGCQLNGFDVAALHPGTYVAQQHFVASRGFSFAPSPHDAAARNPFVHMRWTEPHPNRWLSDASGGDAEALHRLAVIRERQRRDEEARKLHEEAAVVADPEQKEWAALSRTRLDRMPWLQARALTCAEAVQHVRAGRLEAAMNMTRKGRGLSKVDRKRLGAEMSAVAWKYLKKKSVEQTVRAYNFAIELGCDNFVVRNNLGVALEAKGDVEGAIEHFRHAVDFHPNEPTPYYKLAKLLDRNKQYREAIVHYSRCAALAKPGEGHTRYGVRRCAYLLTRLGRGSEGIDALHQWLAKDRADVDAQQMLAAFLCSAGRHRNAYEVLEPLLASESPTPKVQLLASVALLAMGKTDVAADRLRTFCRKSGATGRAESTLADVLFRGVDLEAVAKSLTGSDAAQAEQFNAWLDLARAEVVKRRASLDPKEQVAQPTKAKPLPVLSCSEDLLVNPGCEEPVADKGIPGWVATFGEQWSPRAKDPAARTGKSYFFCGVGPSGELRQDLGVERYRSKIAAGQQAFAFEGYVRSWRDGKDTSRIVVEYLDQSKDRTLAAYDSGQVRSPLMWTKLEDRRLAPRDTHYIRVRLIARRYEGKECDGYFDDLSLRAVTSPISEIPDLKAEQIESRTREAKPPGVPPRLRRSLMLHYAFDRDEGRRVSDISGRGRHGQVFGARYTPAGRFGGGCRFDGHNDFLNAVDVPVGGAFTIALWANLECLQKGQTIAGKHTARGGNILLFDLREGHYHVRIRDATHQHGQAVRRWQHLALTCTSEDGKTTKATVYVDSAVVWEQVLPAAIGDSRGKPWTIGQDWDGGSTSDFFEGVVDELMIFNCALSEADIREIGGSAKSARNTADGDGNR